MYFKYFLLILILSALKKYFVTFIFLVFFQHLFTQNLHVIKTTFPDQKKMKKTDKFKKGGHLGCSFGYDFILYKQRMKDDSGIDINSQTREEMHSTLEKCTATLRQKNYQMFMRWITC